MTFEGAVRSGFRNWNQTGGRSRRSEYWWWILFTFLATLGAALVVGILAGIVGSATQGVGAALGLLVFLGVLLLLVIPTLTVSIRRLHDTNRSGWWLLINLVPYIGSFILLVLYCLDGSPGPNRFGERPGGNLPTFQPAGPLIGVADELRKLEELRVAGTISEEEFARQRARLMPS